jgi:hypothetical protein
MAPTVLAMRTRLLISSTKVPTTFATSGAGRELHGTPDSGGLDSIGGYLGDHDDLGQPLPGELQDALEQCLREMKGGGVWRSPKSRRKGILRLMMSRFASSSSYRQE